MQESVGTPSSCTVQAPQWPSPHAIFVPVNPRSSRKTCASDRPTGASKECVSPLMRSSGRRRHRHDVGKMDEPEGGARVLHAVPLIPIFRERQPHVLRDGQELPDLIELLAVPVDAVVAGVQRQAEYADSILLSRP